MTRASFLGRRAGYLLLGLAFPSLFTLMMAALGIALPLLIPTAAGAGMAVGLSFIPVVEVRHRAAAAREEFSRAVASYMDLVALDKRAGAGTSSALLSAAGVADSWAFARIRAQILQAELAGTSPWDALTTLGEDLGVPALVDLGDIMRLSGVEGVGVYGALRGRAAAARDQLLASDQARANAASEALAMPVAALGLSFLALLGTPALLQIAFSL
jgi:Flp pilus assembly protein TadB